MTALFEGLPPQTIIATYLLGALGSAVGAALHLPLPFLTGALFAVGGAGALGVRFWGLSPAVPQRWRYVLVPFVGVAVGAAVPPGILDTVFGWWPSLMAMVLVVPAMHLLGYVLFHRLGGLDKATAYFAAMPGGLIEAIAMGERFGAQVQMLIALQFLRLTLSLVLIPFGFALVFGPLVGSGGAAGAAPEALASSADVFLLIAAGWGGWALAQLCRVPAPMLTGPMLASAFLHASGLWAGTSPAWGLVLTQWALGTALGARLSGFPKAALPVALGLALAQFVATLALVATVALGLALFMDEPVTALILALAPGGVNEMALVALALELSVVFVSLHHILRILLAVALARLGLRLMRLS